MRRVWIWSHWQPWAAGIESILSVVVSMVVLYWIYSKISHTPPFFLMLHRFWLLEDFQKYNGTFVLASPSLRSVGGTFSKPFRTCSAAWSCCISVNYFFGASSGPCFSLPLLSLCGKVVNFRDWCW